MKAILNNFLSLLFPNTCIVCKSLLIAGEDKLCLSCLSKLPCITPYDENNPAKVLFAGRPEIEAAHAFLHYGKGSIVQKLIFSLKYYDNKELGLILGRMAAHSIARQTGFMLPDILVPVPLHKRRLRQRGYNQAEWIARGFSSVWDRPLDTIHLVREKHTDTQTRKSVFDRITTLETSFSLTNCHIFEGKHILLIDDVVTSGATVDACIKELTQCNNIKISIFCLSIAQ